MELPESIQQYWDVLLKVQVISNKDGSILTASFFNFRRALQNPNDSQEERLQFEFSPTIENYNLTTILINLNFVSPKELTISD